MFSLEILSGYFLSHLDDSALGSRQYEKRNGGGPRARIILVEYRFDVKHGRAIGCFFYTFVQNQTMDTEQSSYRLHPGSSTDK